MSKFFSKQCRSLEIRKGLPGANSVRANRRYWDNYDWSTGGEHWSISPQWRQALIDEFINPYLVQGNNVLEVGPGGGRWTEALYKRAGHLFLIDIAPVTLDVCRAKFGEKADISYIVGDGVSLTDVPNQSIDFVWSFDVFVHIAPADQRAYLAEFKRVMRRGATAVIHHGGRGHGDEDGQRPRWDLGWRSAMTADLFASTLAEVGLQLTKQVEAWGPEGCFSGPTPGDVISVFEA